PFLSPLIPTSPPSISPLSLHDALPISSRVATHAPVAGSQILTVLSSDADASRCPSGAQATELTQLLWPSRVATHAPVAGSQILRSEEHTSELQSLTNLVCRLLLEKKQA